MQVLAVGSHPDDLEFGCGGTLRKHVLAGDHVTMLVMTAGERGGAVSARDGGRVAEQEAAAEVIGADLLWGGFVDQRIEPVHSVIHVVERVIRHVEADVIYGHALDDTHQDHRAIAQATVAAARKHPRVLLYESPTTTNFAPNVYVSIVDTIKTKVAALEMHESQVQGCALLDVEAVKAIAGARGYQARTTSAAEGFATFRFTWDF